MASPDCGYPSPWEWRHLSRPQASSGELAKGKVPDTPRCPPALGHPDPLGALASRRAQASERDETPDFSLLVAEAEAEAEVLQEQTAQLEVVAQVEASPRGVREVGIQCVDRMSLATNTVQCHRRSLANSGECIGGQPPDARRRLASIIRPYGAPPACETSVGDACAFAAADEDASWDGCEVACSDDRMAQEIAESSAQGSSPQACRAPERNALDRREVGVGSFSRISALSAMSSGCNSPPAVTAEEEAERSTAPRHEELSRCHVGHAGTLPAPAAPDAALGQLEYPRWRSDSSSQSFVEFGAGPSTTEMRAALAQAMSRAVGEEFNALEQAWGAASGGSAANGALGLLRRIATKAERAFAVQALTPKEATAAGASEAAAQDIDAVRIAAEKDALDRAKAAAAARVQQLEAQLQTVEDRLDVLRAKAAEVSVGRPADVCLKTLAPAGWQTEIPHDDAIPNEISAEATRAQSALQQCLGRVALVKSWQQQTVERRLDEESAKLAGLEAELLQRPLVWQEFDPQMALRQLL